MRMSRLFSRTLRQPPADTSDPGWRLLLRGGYLRPLAAGAYAFLPLGVRILRRLAGRLEEGLRRLDGQEIGLPAHLPGRLLRAAPEGGEWSPAASWEEAVAGLAGREIQSYRQLPLLLYHRAAPWRESPPAAEGLLAARQPPIVASYLLAAGAEELGERTRAVSGIHREALQAFALEALAAEADPGPEGEAAQVIFTPAGNGPDRFLACPACGYRAESRIAAFRRPQPQAEAPQPPRKVATPQAATIEALCRLLNVPASRALKSIFLMAGLAAEEGRQGERFVLAVVPGDRELSEAKLLRALGAAGVRPAGLEEIRRRGIEPGYGSAVGLPPPGAREIQVIVDSAVPALPNRVAGANEPGFHLLNVNCGRDFQPDRVADLAAAAEGDACPQCGRPLRALRGVTLAGTRLWSEAFSRAAESLYQDPQGRYRPIRLGTQWVDLAGLLVCLARRHRDEAGPVWPPAASPFPLVLVDLCRSPETADRLYDGLLRAGCEALYDDRAESAGVKFADADLSGIPLRLTVGERSLKQGIAELKARREAERRPIPLEEAVERVLREVRSLESPPPAPPEA